MFLLALLSRLCSSPTGPLADLIEAYVELIEVIVALDGLASLGRGIHGVNLFDEFEELALFLRLLLLRLLRQVLLGVLQVRGGLRGEPAPAQAGEEPSLREGSDRLEGGAREGEGMGGMLLEEAADELVLDCLLVVSPGLVVEVDFGGQVGSQKG